MNGQQIMHLENQTGLSAENLAKAGLISMSDLRAFQAQFTGGQRNQMTAGANVNWASVYGFSNMSQQDQNTAQAQGMGPTWNGIPLAFINQHGGVTSSAGGNLVFGDGTMYNQSSGGQAPWAQPAAGAVNGPALMEQARAMGFKPTGPSGTWAYQAQQFMQGKQGGAPGAPGASGGMPGMPGMNFGNAAAQRSAQAYEGAKGQLEQQAAASGDLDRLAYKKSRLVGVMGNAKRQQTTQDALAQVQLAQAMAQPYADSQAVAAYRNRI